MLHSIFYKMTKLIVMNIDFTDKRKGYALDV